jgi:hypothetical protein
MGGKASTAGIILEQSSFLFELNVVSSSKLSERSTIPVRLRNGRRPEEGESALPEPFVDAVEAISKVSIGVLLLSGAGAALSVLFPPNALPAILPRDPVPKSSEDSRRLRAGKVADTAVTFDDIGDVPYLFLFDYLNANF